MMKQDSDELIKKAMRLAIDEGKKSIHEEGKLTPNVGAVIIKDGKILGSSFRGQHGEGDHAEYTLFEKVLNGADVSGAILFTTLEPCTQRKKHKTCSCWIIEKGIRQVYVGMLDPNPVIHKKGCKKLRTAGIEVRLFPPHLKNEIEKDNISFIKQYRANPELTGTVSFDYTNNDGCYTIGNNRFLFKTMWTVDINGIIHINDDSETIVIAIADGHKEINGVTDANAYKYYPSMRITNIEEILIIKNKKGYFAAIKIIDVKNIKDDKSWNELQFEFKILPDKTSDFSKEIVEPLFDPLGYFIHVGTTSSRLFEVIDKQTIKMLKVVSYDISDPENISYLRGITSHIKKDLLPEMKGNPSQLLKKVIVDCNFEEIFNRYKEEPSKQKDFIRDFYKETNLYFNILSKKQTFENLRRLSGDISDKTAIIDIGSHNVDIYVFSDGTYSTPMLDITLTDVRRFVEEENISEIWDNSIINKIKSYIREKTISSLEKIRVDSTIILKDELKFMQDRGYRLRDRGGQLSLSQQEYEKANYEFLFSVNYKEQIDQKEKEVSTRQRLYNFKFGHILVEAILNIMDNKKVVPKDNFSIHGINSYIINVVLSGSTKGERLNYMKEGRRIMEQIGANVLSPSITADEELARLITPDTEYEHLKAIDECDLLFICNKDGYIGESTIGEIYYAYASRKTIAFWKEPPEDKLLSFIPREYWGTIEELLT
jgi:pyrimidine deaminase RibD-like protein